MSNNLVTTNISLPREDWRALKVLAARQDTSMAELIRRSVKRSIRSQARVLIKRRKLTVNGFTPEFEEEVLKAAAEPVDYSEAWESEADIDKFFASVRREISRRKR